MGFKKRLDKILSGTKEEEDGEVGPVSGAEVNGIWDVEYGQEPVAYGRVCSWQRTWARFEVSLLVG